MSAATASSIKTIEIYVPLLNEGTEVIRPTTGQLLERDVIQVLATPDYDPNLEDWQFPPGSKVRCIPEIRDGERLMVARQSVANYGDPRGD
jgi:hypothetical protein